MQMAVVASPLVNSPFVAGCGSAGGGGGGGGGHHQLVGVFRCQAENTEKQVKLKIFKLSYITHIFHKSYKHNLHLLFSPLQEYVSNSLDTTLYIYLKYIHTGWFFNKTLPDLKKSQAH